MTSDSVFEGSVPEFYERYLVPLIFEPYAADLAERLSMSAPERVLEVAAGTGVVTRAMSVGLHESTAITATDLNRAMIDRAAEVGTARPVTWRQADVMSLPFEDDMFDAVVCQFSVMFFPDKRGAYREVRRVLKPGGVFLFNVWDHIGNNEFADVVTQAVGEMFPDDPPLFMERTPHGYFDREQVHDDLTVAGFSGEMGFDPVERRSRAETCDIPAIAYCQGTPLKDEIEARRPGSVLEATQYAADAIGERFGQTNVDGKVRGFVVSVTKAGAREES